MAGIALAQEMEEMEEMTFTLTSSAFEDGQRIPSKYTCSGIIMDDPDAPGGTWVHWVIWNIDPALGGLDEALDTEGIGAVLGKNSWSKSAYGGPCPPSGVHRYNFKIYALSDYPDVNPGASKSKLKRAIKDITLAEYTLMGTYSK
jgi:Raf kinase inhibitor-like YbhB/YbcL family protein